MDSSGKAPLSEESNENKKCCADCKTTKTPLWRSGPSGPKSLCNACGIRYRKKRNVIVGFNKSPEKRKEKSTTITIPTQKLNCNKSKSYKVSGKEGDSSEDLRTKFIPSGKEVLLFQRQSSPIKRQRSSWKLGEVERAAFLLMALSSGSVFA